MRFTVTFGAAFERLRPRIGAIAEFGTEYSAASGLPWSLRSVPAICTSTRGIVHEPSPVNRVIVDSTWHHGMAELMVVNVVRIPAVPGLPHTVDCALSSGSCERTSHESPTVL